MKIRNTQLAAAAIALGEKLLDTTNFNCADVIFDFEDSPKLVEYDIRWREMWAGLPIAGIPPSDDKLSMMFKLSKARQWILETVIHGNHNAGLVLPGVTCEIPELHLACWLVANDHYLLKLERDRRVFHFAVEASSAIASFGDYARSYLKELDYLIRRIGCRDLARQKVMPVV
jgi:hypothetical protein